MTEPSQITPQRSSRPYGVVMLGFVGQLLLQFGLQKILAYRFGASLDMDAYVHAINLPLGLSAMIAGPAGTVLITILGQGDRQELRRFVGTLCLCLTGAMLLLAAGLSWVGLELMQVVNPGFAGAKLLATAALFRLLVWLIPLNVLIGLLQAVHNSQTKFLLPALAGVFGPACTVAIVGLAPRGNVELVALATVTGALLNVLLQLPWAIPYMAWPAWQVGPYFRTALWLGVPILGAMLLLRLDLLTDKYVLSLLKIDGVSAQHNYAWQILSGFLMIASGALSTVTFPRITASVSQGKEAIQREVAQGLGVLLLLCLPAMAAVGIFARALVRDVFEGGQFTAEDSALVGRLLQLYTPMILGAALSEQSGKTLTALRDTVTPNVILSSCVGLGIVAKLLLVPGRDVHTLVAITPSMWLLAGLTQFSLAVRRVGTACLAGSGWYLLVSCLGTAVAIGTGWGVLQTAVPYSGLAGLCCGGAVYGLVLKLLGSRYLSTAQHPS